MGPMQIHERIQRERKRIHDELQACVSPSAYVKAYDEAEQLLLWASIETARCDPSFGLRTMTYDQIIAREA